jgi:hypothetical protein
LWRFQACHFWLCSKRRRRSQDLKCYFNLLGY